MEMSRENLEKLSQRVRTDPDLLQQLTAASDRETAVALLTQAASSSGIAFDDATLEQWLALQKSLQEATLMEDELETVVAGYSFWDYLRDLLNGNLPRNK